MELNHDQEKANEGSNDCTIDINEDSSTVRLAAAIKETLPLKASSICSIYRVPVKMRDWEQKRFKPLYTSIGPYHHKTQNFIVPENHKKWYLHNLISRSTPPKTSLLDLVQAIKALENEARASYAEEIYLNSDEFVTLMVVDGCFIIELVYKYYEDCRTESKAASADLIFSGDGAVVNRLMRDLVLLENQLPYIVLDCLFQKTMDSKQNCTLNQLIRNFLKPIIPTNIIPEDDDIKGEHILDMVRNLILPSQSLPMAQHGDKFPINNDIYPQYSATELREVGIRFERKEGAASLVDITFNMMTGVLAIPPFNHGRGINSLIKNLIALEQPHPSYKKEISSYAILLDSLINSKDDVQLLSKSGIIDHLKYGDQKIASDINKLCPGLKARNFQYKELCHGLNRYNGRGFPRVRRKLYKWNVILHRDYLSSPWTVFSSVAAVVLLVLTFMQTIYTVSPPR